VGNNVIVAGFSFRLYAVHDIVVISLFTSELESFIGPVSGTAGHGFIECSSGGSSGGYFSGEVGVFIKVTIVVVFTLVLTFIITFIVNVHIFNRILTLEFAFPVVALEIRNHVILQDLEPTVGVVIITFVIAIV
jgi:hypothetical protein